MFYAASVSSLAEAVLVFAGPPKAFSRAPAPIVSIDFRIESTVSSLIQDL